jgi:inner membrane protein
VASAFAHVFVAASLGAAVMPRPRARVITAGIVCSVLPDVDVVGFFAGVSYGDLLGHRGLTHSLPFAAIVAVAVALLFFRGAAWAPARPRIVAYLFVATASHGVLDALTDGGLGVAFLAPFDATRSFLPFRPVVVSPIGIAEFFTPRALPVRGSEVVWIVLPWSLFCLGIAAARRGFSGKSRSTR